MDALLTETLDGLSKGKVPRYPYFYHEGQYRILRIYRFERSSKGLLRARIYDRKNDRWGKTPVGVSARYVEGLLDEGGIRGVAEYSLASVHFVDEDDE